MHQLSSGYTLLLRLFIPTVWIVFFGSFMVMGWLWEEDFIGPFPRDVYRWASTIFVLSGIVMFRVTLWRLHRADADQDVLMLSNYFRTYRYPVSSISHIDLKSYGLFHLCRVVLIAPGKLGRTVWFLPSKKRLESFINNSKHWPFRI